MKVWLTHPYLEILFSGQQLSSGSAILFIITLISKME